MYGLGLDHLHKREFYKADEACWGVFPAHADIREGAYSGKELQAPRRHGELALLDVREQGVHYRGHPFFACAAPLSRLEMVIADLVPRKSAPIVVLDGGEGPGEKAAKRCPSSATRTSRSSTAACAAWKAAGFELFSGVNVPSKAFGEFVEHHYDTPRITPPS